MNLGRFMITVVEASRAGEISSSLHNSRIMDSSDVTIWHPADVFSDNPANHKGFALIALNQPLELPSVIYRRLWDNAIYHIAADGGANRVYEKNHSTPFNAQSPHSSLTEEKKANNYLDIDTVIGDFDSMDSGLKQYFKNKGTEIIRDDDQYSTDFTKAVKYAKTFERPTDSEWSPSSGTHQAKLKNAKSLQTPLNIMCLGGLGGRVDQGLSQLHHLYMFQQEPNYSSGKMFLVSSEAITFVLKTGKHKIKVRDGSHLIRLGKHVGIIPIKEPSVITTNGLEWDVTDWATEFGGQISTSNHVKDDWAFIETTKDVIFTIDLVINLSSVER
jgi:thiamine pyrophosphokinase